MIRLGRFTAAKTRRQYSRRRGGRCGCRSDRTTIGACSGGRDRTLPVCVMRAGCECGHALQASASWTPRRPSCQWTTLVRLITQNFMVVLVQRPLEMVQSFF